MILHKSPQIFKEAIEATAQYMKIRPVFIEKDYWVCYVLKNLSQSKYADDIVFKGGTSLSKAYACIERFSEDIDLAILSPQEHTGNQLAKLLKTISENITTGLINIPGHPKENKFGRIRTTVYEYEKVISNLNFGSITDYILVEINCFANPIPHNHLPIQTYIAQFLEKNGSADLIEVYHLQPFIVQVLSLQRTYFEKLLAINRLSYQGIKKLKEKIRHFYDIYHLHYHPELKGKILLNNNFEIVSNVLTDDEYNKTMDGIWKGKPLSESPFFTELEGNWDKLSDTYKSELTDLIWAKDLPSADAILIVLNEIKIYIQQYDKLNFPKQ